MNKKILSAVLLFSLLFCNISCVQKSEYESKFEWMKNTFEENDAGFQYIIDKKGQQAYDLHNRLISDKIKSVKTFKECVAVMEEWLSFFRSGHIGIEVLNDDESKDGNATNADGDYETTDIDIPEFEKYIAQKKNAGYEGVWETGAYKIGIKQEGSNYIGFIISSQVDEWKTGQIKLRITKENDKNLAVFYMRDHSAVEYEDPELIGNNHLKMGRTVLTRLSPDLPKDKSMEDYLKFLSSQTPYVDNVNETTVLLRIPYFDIGEKTIIDSVILANREKILSTENLIIDVRNNGGGADHCYSQIIPFLYTNPIRTVGLQFRSAPLNNQMMKDFATNPEYDFDDEMRKWFKDVYEKMEQHPNEFVDISSDIITIDERDTVFYYPRKVAILINGGNASTTEQFLLAAKQSKKVKLFGTTTSGALDASNMNSAVSPDKDFRLWFCMSKSYRIPDMAIDDIGIQPDYYMDETIPDHKWVEFTTGILEDKSPVYLGGRPFIHRH